MGSWPDCRRKHHKPKLYDVSHDDFKVDEGQITFDAEGEESSSNLKMSRIAHIPGRKSGVTIGRGYDVKERSKDAVYNTLTAIGVDETTANAYAGAVGKHGIGEVPVDPNHPNGPQIIKPEKSACKYYNENFEALKPITPAQQKILFEIIYTFKLSEVIRVGHKPSTLKTYGAFDWTHLHPKARDILVDLMYQGANSPGTRRRFQAFVSDINKDQDTKLSGFKTILKNKEFWGSLGVNSTRAQVRIDQAENIDNLFVNPDGELPGQFTFNCETSSNDFTPQLYKDPQYGIVIGKGYTLGKRKCFKDAIGFSAELEPRELTGHLRYVGINDPIQLQAFVNAAGLTGGDAQNYLTANRTKLGRISVEIERKLFNLAYPAYEADAIRICTLDSNIAKYGLVNWVRLDPKIKTILIDLIFTDHYNFPDVISKVHKHVVNNDPKGFAEALKWWDNWVPLRNKQSIWESRFEKRIEYLQGEQPIYNFVSYGQFTFDIEGVTNSRKPHLTLNSSYGITIGRGYDLGKHTKEEVEIHLSSAGAAPELIEELADAAGKLGSYELEGQGRRDAFLHWKAPHKSQEGKTNQQVLESLEISKRVQKNLFEITYPIAEAQLVSWIHRQDAIGPKAFNGIVKWKNLDPRIRTLLIDSKYRGDFFGDEEIYDPEATPYHTLHNVIYENSHGLDNISEFIDIIKQQGAFPSVHEDRLRSRLNLLELDLATNSQKLQTALSVTGEFTFQAEKRSDNGKAYVPDSCDGAEPIHDKPGIVIGRGFNLRTRHCYKAKDLNFRSTYFPKEEDTAQNEIVRPQLELEQYLKTIHIPPESEKGSKIILGRTFKGNPAQNHLTNTDFPTLTPEEQQSLFDLSFACYESDAVLILSLPKMLKHYKVPCINWSRLDPRIKTVLVDLCFTGDFNFISRRFLFKHIANNDLESFKNALSPDENWSKKKFRWNEDTRSKVATPPSQKSWNTRFQKRIELLNQEVIPLVCNAGIPRALSMLEPATMCHIDSTDYAIKKSPFALAELMQLLWIRKLQKNTDSDSSDFREPSPSPIITPFDSRSLEDHPMEESSEGGEKDDELPESDESLFKSYTGDDYTIGDIYFPIPGASYFVEVIGPKHVRLILNGDDNPAQKGHRLRYKDTNTQSYKYEEIETSEGADLTFKNEIEIDTTDPVQFDIPFFLPLNKMGIGDLLGDAIPAIETVISSAHDLIDELKKHVEVKRRNGKIVGIIIPLKLSLFIPKKKGEKEIERQPLDFYWNVEFRKEGDQWLLNNESGKFYLCFPESKEEQLIEFGIFTLVIPPREKPLKRIVSEKESDGYFDLSKREIGLTLHTIKRGKGESVDLYFPGGISDEVKNSPEDRLSAIKKAKKKRFLLEFEKFNLKEYEPQNDNEFFLRLNPQGLSVKAKVTDDPVSVQDTSEGLLKDIELKPQKQSGGIESRIFIVNNTIKEATLFAKMLLPGFKNLEASVSASLKQKKAGDIPSVIASIHLENNNESALAELDMEMLQMRLDAIRLSLSWSPEGSKWDFDAFVDGQISLTAIAKIIPDLENLKSLSAIKIENLNLKELNLPNVSAGFNLREPTKIDILDGLFTCRFDDLRLDWKLEKGSLKSLSGSFICENCSFRFNRPGIMDVEVQAGELHVQYDNGEFKIEIPSSIGLNVKIGAAVHFAGELGWIDDSDRGVRYFYASGSLKLEGFPEIKALLKFGSLRKDNGEPAINMVIYAEAEVEQELFAGAVVKKLGGGIGVNNRLRAIDATPNEREILENINSIKPELESSWQEVTDNGLYLSIVASAMIASNRGSASTFNAYIMSLILSIDTNFEIVAAGKLWLASSMGYIHEGDNYDRPALIGALVLSPRQQRLGVELRSQQNAAIESNDLLKTILSKTTTRLAFRLTPELVDYHLQEISYRDTILGVRVAISGSYRIAAFRRALLAKAGISIEGHFSRSFRAGPGGFTCNGHLMFRAEYGGMISGRGLDLYGLVSASLGFQVSAFITIGFRISFKIAWKRITISFHKTFRISLPRIQLGFHGAIALSGKGKAGFDGFVSISVSICGYTLSIKPHLSFNPGVISDVKNRIAAFERLLDQFGENKMAQLGYTPLSLTRKGLINQGTQEWLHYTSKTQDESDEQLVFRHTFVPKAESLWMTPYRDSNFNPESRDEPYKKDVRKIAVGKVGSRFSVRQVAKSEGLIKVWVQDLNVPQWERNQPIVLKVNQPDFDNIWHIQSINVEERLLLLSKTPQNSPPPFPENSENVVELNSDTAFLFQPKLVLYSPWIYQHATYFNLDTDQFFELKCAFLESTLDETYTEEPMESTREAVYDPRVESPSREFMSQEAQLLPEHVLSAHFTPYGVSPNDFNSTSRDELEMIKKYEALQHVIVQDARHHAFDPSPEEDQLQAKTQILNALLSDLNKTSSEDERMFETHHVKVKGETTEVFGLIYESPEETFEGETSLYIQRNDDSKALERVDVVKPDKQAAQSTGGLKDKIKLLKIRQDYLALDTGTSGEEMGKIVLSLPIKIDPTLFEKMKLSQIGYFRIYKTSHENDELLQLADRIQPKFWKHRERKEIDRGVIEYSGDELLSLEGFSSWSEKYEIEVNLQEIGSVTNPKQFTFFYSKEENTLVGQGEVSNLIPGSKYSYTVTTISRKAQYLVEPYLYKDEIIVRNRRFDLSEGTKQAFVDYYLEIIPTGSDITSNTKKSPSDLMFWNREYLYIPEKIELPDQLSIVFSVESLLLNTAELGSFKILEGENQTVWTPDPQTFELWVKQMPIEQTGFYAGDADFAELEPPTDSPFIDDLSVEKRYESTDGKQKITFDPDSYKITSNEIFQEDSSYQFYIGFKQGGSQKLLPMEHLLVKSFPKTWDKNLKFKSVSQIEWILEESYVAVRDKKADMLSSSEFLANSVYQHGANFIETQFNCSNVNTGGIETFLIDLDEPGYSPRQYCEVQSRSIFMKSKQDFRDPAAWQSPYWALFESQSLPLPQKTSIFSTTDELPDTINTYYKSDSDLIEELKDSAEDFAKILEASKYTWKNCYTQGLKFILNLNEFEKSPLNINFQPLNGDTKKIKQYLINLLLGTHQEKTLDDLLSDIGTIEEGLNQESKEDEGSYNSEEEKKAANLRARDRELARRLLGIIQRRLAIVNDLLANLSPESLPATREIDLLLPRLNVWKGIREEYEDEEVGKHSHEVLELFKAPETRTQETQIVLKKVLEDFKKYFEKGNDKKYLEALCRIVPLAKDMTALLDTLASKVSLRKQMHHSVMIDGGGDSHTQPQDVDLKHFMPESSALLEKNGIEAKEIFPSQNKLLLHFFTLMEYLGFAVDIKVITEAQKPLEQPFLIDHLNQLENKWSQSVPFILRGMAPNTTHSEEEMDTYAFVKIALLPKKLFQREAESITFTPINERQIAFEGGNWSEEECYIFEVSSGEGKSEAFFSTKIEKENSITTVTLNRAISPNIHEGQRFQYKANGLKALLQNRGVKLPAQENLYNKYFGLIAFQLEQFARRAQNSFIPEIPLERSSKRWVTLPAKGGISKAIWEVPDRFGHRYQVAMRQVSRYEPLINWHIGRHEMVPLLQPSSDPDKPSFHHKLVRIKPIEYGIKRRNEEQMLQTYNYPHPEKALFSYQLPIDAARALKSQIASVRTGYRGCDLVFHHELVDDKEKAKLEDILNAMKQSDTPIDLKRFNEYEEAIVRTLTEPQIRLFDHERLFTLTNLPYYYRFFMNVRTLYNSHTPPHKAKHLPPPISANITPTNLYTFQQEVVLSHEGDDLVYHFTLYPSRHMDNLTPLELTKEPHSLSIESNHNNKITFQARDIPDLTSIYNICWKKNKKGVDNSRYILVTSLHMPWSDDHGKESPLFPRLKDTHCKFKIESVGPPSFDTTPEGLQESRVPIEFIKLNPGEDSYEKEKQYLKKRVNDSTYQVPETLFAYKIQFRLRIAKKDSIDEDVFHDVNQFTLQITRNQALANKVDFKAEAISGEDS